jgi:dimeric dUTPase (all-alpha-NTP-PPase superfamily)
MTKQVTPLSAEQLDELAAMQDHLNQLTCQANFGHTDWRSMSFNWALAILDEVMEIHGHLGWKWWKGSDKYQVGLTEENKKQVQLEVIDILHFLLSKGMQDGEDWQDYCQETVALNDCLNELVHELEDYFPWNTFNSLCKAVDLDATEIVEIYTGKYALNIFRQDHGYGEGTYLKEWLIPEISIKYQEDNWYLEKTLGDIKRLGAKISFPRVYAELEAYYKLATGGGK